MAKPNRVKAGTSPAEAAKRRAIFIEKMVELRGNITQSAIAAGFSQKTASQQGHRLLKDVRVSKEVARRRAEAIELAKCDANETLISAARVIRFDPRKLVRKDEKGKPQRLALHELDDDTALALETVEVDGMKVRVDRSSARAQLMKHHGLFEKDNKQLPAPTLSVGRLTARLSFDQVRAKAKAAAKRT